ncbi:hypothetical protein K474DRAFT_1713158 [Panus rudis PR-1116 ss-1]|nr:hypothetical protein K474DRAFT_1713158 [Panus rudis PR-1116 ss-1]
MLSSLVGFDTKSSRTAPARNNSKLLEVPRGFSYHVFRNPSPTPAIAPAAPAAAKLEYSTSQSRAPSNTNKLTRQDSERKPSPPETRPHQLSVYAPPFEPKRSKSQRPYQIYPSSIPDTYIYERSVSSATDLLSSPSSSSSSDDEFNSDAVVSVALEVSSTRASSSTETLETTALLESTTLYPAPPPTRGIIPTTTIPKRNRVTSLSAPQTSRQYSTTPYSRPYEASDDDSDTVISDDVPYYYSTSAPLRQPSNVPATGASVPLSIPVRRNGSEQPPRVPVEVPSTVRPPLRHSGSSGSGSGRQEPTSPVYDEHTPRAPPGLQHGPVPPAPSRRSSSSSHHSGSAEATMVVATKRSVRWTENLVCPSPMPRRKGWYNRRGDQLWTNDGRYKAPEPGQEYPPDLANYPEPNAGWMNESGVRIDMNHRLIPKPPLRSALRRPRTPSSQGPIIDINNVHAQTA